MCGKWDTPLPTLNHDDSTSKHYLPLCTGMLASQLASYSYVAIYFRKLRSVLYEFSCIHFIRYYIYSHYLTRNVDILLRMHYSFRHFNCSLSIDRSHAMRMAVWCISIIQLC